MDNRIISTEYGMKVEYCDCDIKPLHIWDMEKTLEKGVDYEESPSTFPRCTICDTFMWFFTSEKGEQWFESIKNSCSTHL